MCFKCYSDEPTEPVPAPAPEVKHYRGLADFQSLHADTIVVAIDLEGIDHRNGTYAKGLENWEKVSEVGVSYIDLRDIRLASDSTSSTERLSTISKFIVSHHKIINRWRNFTEETCDAPHHETHGKPHTAMPYHCMVAESQFGTHEEAISDLDRLLRDLSTKDLTAEEMEAGMRRTVIVLYWDARMESSWFHDMEFDVGWYGAIELDFQKFKPFRSRFEKAKTGAGKAFESLGALGTGAGGMAVLHNAANDTFTQVVAFLRFMLMTEDEWKEWRGRSDYYPGDLDPIDLSWINDQIWKSNQELRPMLQPGEKPEEVQDPEDPEPVIVHYSGMAEIKAGVTSTTVGSAPNSSSWADALRKPVEKASDFTQPWSPTSSWPSTTWTSTSSSWDWKWKSTTTLSSAWDLPEAVEDDHAGLPTKSTKSASSSPAAAPTSTLSTTEAEEGSDWTVVANTKPRTKSTPTRQSTISSPVDNKSGKSDHRPNKRATGPTRPGKPRGSKQLINAPPNAKTAPATAQTPTKTKTESTEKTVSNSEEPKPVPERSSAAIHWAKLRSTGKGHARRPD